MKSTELRQKFLDFFASNGHEIIPSGSLLPENDPTVLFTTAGMQPLVPYLLGQPHPAGKRLASCQKCVRTDDIEEVGDATHLTFFEMLGNWSLDDYEKEEAIKFSWKFLTEILQLPKEKLAVSVFAGDSDAPFDEKAFNIWKNEIGLPESRIAKLGKKENWWGPAGQTGPCGPDTEMFYWTGSEPTPESFQKTCTDSHWVEIWNDVFMQYEKQADGKFAQLKQKNVDTGLGLERVVTILQGKQTVYETDLFSSIISKIKSLAGILHAEGSEETGPRKISVRIIADHLRAATFIIGDPRGVPPSNVDQGYVVRKLIRRAIRHARKIGIDLNQSFTDKIADVVVREYGEAYPELRANHEKINALLTKEEEQFKKTLEKGEKEIFKRKTKQFEVSDGRDNLIKEIPGSEMRGDEAFYFFETYGFPKELTEEIARENKMKLSKNFNEEFDKAEKIHQKKSRIASAGKFSGGLADDSTATTALHTATHLLHTALRRVLGEHVAQKGSNITAERLRFDFTQPEKLTLEQKEAVEKLVNEQIEKDLPISCEEMTVEEAKASGAIGLFESKYGEKVKVYTVGEFSKEICGGPHVERTGKLGKFKIKKEESSSAGIRRIKAVLTKD